MSWVEFKDKSIYKKSKTPFAIMATKIDGGYYVVIDNLNGSIKYKGYKTEDFNNIFE